MSNNISWTAEAEGKLKEIPFFVRPAARKKIENFAQEQGSIEVSVQVYELAKAAFKR
jgi:Proto-chlorophyllide reductase 57 kD subunit